jgi:lipid-binding SYLF domain-containing protein
MKTPLLRLAFTAALLALPTVALHAEKKTFRQQLGEKLESCEYTFEVIMGKAETAIPLEILHEAKGIVIVHQIRAGFIVGGQGGSAVMMARHPQTGKWGPPVFLDPGGVSIGFQAGVKEVNTVFVLNTAEAVRKAYSGRFDIGADAVAVAGPRTSEREKFKLFEADVFIYSSYGGLYAGASLKTGWIKPYDRGTREIYETKRSTPEIVMSNWFIDKIPQEARPMYNRVAGLDSLKTQ